MFGLDQAAGERSLYIPRQASATGKIFIHQFFIIFSTGTFHRRSLSLQESLTCRLVFQLFTGTVDVQHGSKPDMESSGQHHLAIFSRRISRFSRGPKRVLKILFIFTTASNHTSCFPVHVDRCSAMNQQLPRIQDIPTE